MIQLLLHHEKNISSERHTTTNDTQRESMRSNEKQER